MTLGVCDGECHELISRCRRNRLAQRDMKTDEDWNPQEYQQYGAFHVSLPALQNISLVIVQTHNAATG
jgi:hypothetical protein